MNIEFSQEEIGGLMRSLLRSSGDTPEREKALHESLYSKLGNAYVDGMDPELRSAVGRAIDAQIGR